MNSNQMIIGIMNHLYIKIYGTIYRDDTNYEISGNVTDQSKKIFIEIDGQSILTKNGKFSIKI